MTNKEYNEWLETATEAEVMQSIREDLKAIISMKRERNGFMKSMSDREIFELIQDEPISGIKY